MTEMEAIKELSYDNTAYGGRCTEEVRRVAIHALSEIQQYRAIGTVEDIEKSMQNVSVLLAEHELLKLYQSIGTIDEFKALEQSKENEPKKTNSFSGCICNNIEMDWDFMK